jgi:D-3-phosphoglycerate dehydrogenase
VARTALTAILEVGCNEGQVNIVNAPAMAQKMGLDLVESTINAVTEFSELLVAELTKGDIRFRLAGTIIGRSPRIVEINHHYVDTNISGHFLIVHNDDRPGIVGAVGTVLGEAQINIANMSLARNKKKGRALTVIEVDQALDTEVMETLRSVPGIQSATGVTM